MSLSFAAYSHSKVTNALFMLKAGKIYYFQWIGNVKK